MDVAEVLMFVGLCWLALQARHIILYVAACILCLFWGFEVADANLMDGIPILICGGYMLYASIMWFWSK